MSARRNGWLFSKEQLIGIIGETTIRQRINRILKPSVCTQVGGSRCRKLRRYRLCNQPPGRRRSLRFGNEIENRTSAMLIGPTTNENVLCSDRLLYSGEKVPVKNATGWSERPENTYDGVWVKPGRRTRVGRDGIWWTRERACRIRAEYGGTCGETARGRRRRIKT